MKELEKNCPKEMSYNSKVSIIMPVYNGEKFVRRSIDSILNQTYKGWELIVVNDASSDNSIEVINEYLNNDRIKLVNNEVNLGPAGTRNSGIRHSTGEFVAFLDCDDWWAPTKLEVQIKEMVDNKLDICSTDVKFFYEKSGTFKSYEINRNWDFVRIKRNNFIILSSSIVNKDILIDEPFPLNVFNAVEDWGFWLQIVINFKKVKYRNVNKALTFYSINEENISKNKLSMIKKVYHLKQTLLKNNRLEAMGGMIIYMFNSALKYFKIRMQQ